MVGSARVLSDREKASPPVLPSAGEREPSVPAFREDGRRNRPEQFVENPPRDRVGDVTHLKARQKIERRRLPAFDLRRSQDLHSAGRRRRRNFDGRCSRSRSSSMGSRLGAVYHAGLHRDDRMPDVGPILPTRGRRRLGHELEVLARRRIRSHPPDTAGDGTCCRGHHGPFEVSVSIRGRTHRVPCHKSRRSPQSPRVRNAAGASDIFTGRRAPASIPAARVRGRRYEAAPRVRSRRQDH